ncbi:hypothetical protein GEMRC1_004944 [Eukaryota sp. GEM-RC1]
MSLSELIFKHPRDCNLVFFDLESFTSLKRFTIARSTLPLLAEDASVKLLLNNIVFGNESVMMFFHFFLTSYLVLRLKTIDDSWIFPVQLHYQVNLCWS